MFKTKFGFLGFRSLRDHPLSTPAKFSLRVMFLLSVVLKVRVRISGWEMFLLGGLCGSII